MNTTDFQNATRALWVVARSEGHPEESRLRAWASIAAKVAEEGDSDELREEGRYALENATTLYREAA